MAKGKRGKTVICFLSLIYSFLFLLMLMSFPSAIMECGLGWVNVDSELWECMHALTALIVGSDHFGRGFLCLFARRAHRLKLEFGPCVGR
ncbi:hypothetical protein SERLA73DRAFT_175613 [Serpula lacrymans var. lacrymans S7.3]|uniref:Uncharacterized protein n=2 Tax=Serpula lacrymans var. lacrymans TaxID=341189 RepID=F8PKW4_SERL3|nr:uncharacterized protein SERLADRAFT_458157 [Serpula lacrymans var. lacrymans S7.9]EGO03923.1 hypothetical protein SERLA73DRAFT_175613 [Serpula lacrymans var. lacrymans S7.3]EGO29847.1 hypothetical protein SERLADRAFT_458157 [Serpula lacrymans var. lacrymans S7.9]